MMQTEAGQGWERYGKALIADMVDVLAEAPEEQRPLLLETADFWLALGLSIGLERADDARRLLGLMDGSAAERAELTIDATAFCEQALG